MLTAKKIHNFLINGSVHENETKGPKQKEKE